MSEWSVGLLGKVTLHRNAHPFKLTPRETQLLVLVVLAGPTGIERSAILDRMWAGEPSDKSSPNLRNLIVRFKRDLPLLLHIDGSTTRLNDEVALDLNRFRELASAGQSAAQQGRGSLAVQQYRAALALWRGEVLAEDIDQSVVDPADTLWDNARTDVVEQLAAVLTDIGDDAGVIDLLQSMVDDGNERVRIITRLAEALYRNHQPDEAREVIHKAMQRVTATGHRVAPAWLNLQDYFASGEPLPRTTDSAVPSVPHLLARSCAAFVGRSELLQHLDCGMGRATMLVGASGIGKTSIAGCAASLAVATRASHVLLVRCEPTDQRPLDAFSRATGHPFDSVEAAYTWVILQMEQQPQLLVFDDAHHGDLQLIQLISRLSVHAIGDRLGIVITSWPGNATNRLIATDSIERINVGGLSNEELGQFCSVSLGVDFATVSREVITASTGNPMLFQRLVTGDTATTEFHKFAIGDRDLARCAALLGPTIDPTHCAQVLGIQHGEAVDGLTRLEASGLIAVDNDGIRFSHELLRSAVLTSLTGIAESSLASRIARCETLPLWVRARQAPLAAPVEDAQFIDRLLVQGTDAATSEARWADVCELTDFQSQRTTDALQRGRLLFHAALAAERAGRIDSTERRRNVLDWAEAHGDIELALDSVLVPVPQGRSVSNERRIADINRVLALVGAHQYPDAVIRLRAERLAWMGLSGGLSTQTDEIAWATSIADDEANHELPSEVFDEVLRAVITATLGTTDVPSKSRRSALFVNRAAGSAPASEQSSTKQSLVTDDLRADAISLAFRSTVERGNLDELDRLFESGVLAAMPKRSSDNWSLAVAKSTVATLHGDLDEALHHARYAFAIGTKSGSPDSLATWAFQACGLASFGVELHPEERDGLDALFGMAARPAISNNLFALYRSTAAWWFADRNRPFASRCLSDAIGALDLASPDVSLLPAIARIVETSGRSDEHFTIPAKAIRLLAQLGPHHVVAGMTPAWSFGPTSRLLALADGGQTIAMWERAINDCAQQRQHFWKAQTVLQQLASDSSQ